MNRNCVIAVFGSLLFPFAAVGDTDLEVTAYAGGRAIDDEDMDMEQIINTWPDWFVNENSSDNLNFARGGGIMTNRAVYYTLSAFSRHGERGVFTGILDMPSDGVARFRLYEGSALLGTFLPPESRDDWDSTWFSSQGGDLFYVVNDAVYGHVDLWGDMPEISVGGVGGFDPGEGPSGGPEPDQEFEQGEFSEDSPLLEPAGDPNLNSEALNWSVPLPVSSMTGALGADVAAPDDTIQLGVPDWYMNDVKPVLFPVAIAGATLLGALRIGQELRK